MDKGDTNYYYTCPYFRFTPGGRLPFTPPAGPGGPGAPGGPGGLPFSPDGPPSGPPPLFTPPKSQAGPGGPGIKAVDPGAIRPCTYRYVYIWLRNGRSFWAWLTFVGRRSASGYRWNGRRWVYFGIDLRRIDYFVCY